MPHHYRPVVTSTTMYHPRMNGMSINNAYPNSRAGSNSSPDSCGADLDDDICDPKIINNAPTIDGNYFTIPLFQVLVLLPFLSR